MYRIYRRAMNTRIISMVIIVSCLTLTLGFCARPRDERMISEKIKSVADVKNLFPITPDQIKQETAHYLKEAQSSINQIIAIPAEKRTFENTAKALDDLVARSNLEIKSNFFGVMEHLHPDKAMRDMAHDSVKKVREFYVDNISNNKKLYEAFKTYVEDNAPHEQLNAEQHYFLDETMKDFKRAGLDLPDEKLEKVRELKKKLSDLSLQFDRNIADDNRTITVDKAGLDGLGDDFIAMLAQTDDGTYILGVDYPTYFRVMEHSNVEDTRKRLFEAFSNRAYPANKKLLAEIVALRDQVAKLIGYESFAAINIDTQMAHSPQKVDEFLSDLRKRAQKKADQELDKFIAELPPSVALTRDGKVKAWDLARIQTHYKKKHFNIDERKISEYFPMQKTIDALLDIYRQFMGVDFKEVPLSGMWHEDVRLIEVYNKDRSQLLGYLFLDLYPRPNKYSHAAHAGLIPAIKLPDGSRLPAVSVVMANFPKSTKDKPSLLMRKDASTFFHEFGHAVHSQLGATELGSFAGTRVKTDFVEMPSQMLEEWLWDKDILKKVTSHYETGEPLPDEIIDNIIALKQYDSGNFITRQAFLAQYSLDLYKEGGDKNPETLWFAMAQDLLPRMYWGPEYRHYASFGHLTGYGAKYYGYLWSKVFALDLFDAIKKHGLLNPEIGTKYVRDVIGRGGSAHPDELLENFLGRAPNQDAFLKDMGLK